MYKFICQTCFSLLLFISTRHELLGQINEWQYPIVQIHPVQHTITVDGILNDEAWKEGEWIQDFITLEPEEGKQAKNKTKVKLCYDDKNIYVSALCYNAEPLQKFSVTSIRRDFDDLANENLAIAFDMELKGDDGIVFIVSPAANIKDAEIFNLGFGVNENWNSRIFAKTTVTDTCWSVEMQIPFKSMRYKLENTHNEKIIAFRLIRVASTTNELSSYPAFQTQWPKFRLVQTAKIKGIEFPRPSSNLQLRPYTLLLNEGNAKFNESNHDVKFGLDAKWAPKSNTVVDFTINPDFAQAEADEQIINLSRIDQTLPEKWQFFLESASQFIHDDSKIFLPFQSRKLGLDANGAPIPIHFGLRYVQQNLNNKFGALIIQQEEKIDSQKYNAQIEVFSYKHNLNDKVSISGLGTLKNNLKKLDNVENSNACGSIELNRLKNETAMGLTVTGTSNFENKNSNGAAINFWLEQDKKPYWLLMAYELMTSRYNPALGFVTFPNSVEYFLGADKNFWPTEKRLKNFRLFNPGLELDYYFYPETHKLIFLQNRIIPIRFETKKQIYSALYIFQYIDNLDYEFNFLKTTLLPKKYHDVFAFLEFRTNRTKKLFYKSELQWGELYNGHVFRYKPLVRYSPSPALSIQVEWYYHYYNGIGKDRLDQTLHLITPGIKYSLNTKIHFTGFYQYHSINKTGSLNFRFEWEYRPLSYLYLVYNNFQDDLERIYQNQSIVKINYLHQF